MADFSEFESPERVAAPAAASVPTGAPIFSSSPDQHTQKNIQGFEKANPLPFKTNEYPTFILLETWWNRSTRSFHTHFIPVAFASLAMVRVLQTNDALSDLFARCHGGVDAVLRLPLHELHNLCLTLFDVHVEATNALAQLVNHKCTSASVSHVKKYVDDFTRLATTSQNLLGMAIPDALLRVMLVMGAPPKLRKALIKNPAVRTLDQTKSQLLVTAGPIAQNLHLTSSTRESSDPMELDAAFHDNARSPNRPRGPLTPQERLRRQREGLCMYCASKDHDKDNCPLIKARDAARAASKGNSNNNRAVRFNNAEEAAPGGQGNA